MRLPSGLPGHEIGLATTLPTSSETNDMSIVHAIPVQPVRAARHGRLAALTVAALLAVSPSRATAQHAGGGAPLETHAPAEASQLDFLVGQWDLVVKPVVNSLAARMHGTPQMHGSWKAWHALDGWGIEEELRIVDDVGNAMALTRFVRVWDATAKVWRVSTTDAYRAKIVLSTGRWDGATLETSGSAPTTDAQGDTYATRSRITDVTPTSFRYVAERSTDGGKTWTATLTMAATRVADAAAR
jgi:hypothetical protein